MTSSAFEAEPLDADESPLVEEVVSAPEEPSSEVEALELERRRSWWRRRWSRCPTGRRSSASRRWRWCSRASRSPRSSRRRSRRWPARRRRRGGGSSRSAGRVRAGDRGPGRRSRWGEASKACGQARAGSGGAAWGDPGRTLSLARRDREALGSRHDGDRPRPRRCGPARAQGPDRRRRRRAARRVDRHLEGGERLVPRPARRHRRRQRRDATRPATCGPPRRATPSAS